MNSNKVVLSQSIDHSVSVALYKICTLRTYRVDRVEVNSVGQDVWFSSFWGVGISLQKTQDFLYFHFVMYVILWWCYAFENWFVVLFFIWTSALWSTQSQCLNMVSQNLWLDRRWGNIHMWLPQCESVLILRATVFQATDNFCFKPVYSVYS